MTAYLNYIERENKGHLMPKKTAAGANFTEYRARHSTEVTRTDRTVVAKCSSHSIYGSAFTVLSLPTSNLRGLSSSGSL